MNPRGLEKLDIEINSDFVSVRSDDPLKVLSSAVLNPGLCRARSILNYQVEMDFDSPDPEGFIRKRLEKLDLPSPTVGMLTAAEVEDAGTFTCRGDDFSVRTIVTAGITHPLTAGVSNLNNFSIGTVNMIILVDREFTTRAMIDAVRTATEAKCNVFRELDLRDKGGSNVATGTVTDAVTVACTDGGEKAEYAGPATKEGYMIGRGVRIAARDALRDCGFDPSRSIIDRLEERGLPFEGIIETAEEAYVKHPDLDSDEGVSERLETELKKALTDLNIRVLILAGLRLEEDGEKGLIPGLSSEEFRSDPLSLLSDEILWMRIANYLNGSKGVFEFTRIDRTKPGVLSELGPFLDDVIGGLVGGVCSRAYESRD